MFLSSTFFITYRTEASTTIIPSPTFQGTEIVFSPWVTSSKIMYLIIFSNVVLFCFSRWNKGQSINYPKKTVRWALGSKDTEKHSEMRFITWQTKHLNMTFLRDSDSVLWVYKQHYECFQMEKKKETKN